MNFSEVKENSLGLSYDFVSLGTFYTCFIVFCNNRIFVCLLVLLRTKTKNRIKKLNRIKTNVLSVM